jgi:hypothetical protein
MWCRSIVPIRTTWLIQKGSVDVMKDELIQTPYGKKRWSFLRRCMDSHAELLEALQGLLEAAPAPRNGIKQDYSYILHRFAARKAIAKAKGANE